MELYESLESSLHAKNVECLRRQSRVRRSDDVTPDIKIVIKYLIRYNQVYKHHVV